MESSSRTLVYDAVADGQHTVEDVCSVTGLHANTVRAQLRALVDAGRLESTSAQPQGRGRPATRYRRREGMTHSHPDDAVGRALAEETTALLVAGYGSASAPSAYDAMLRGERLAATLSAPSVDSPEAAAADLDDVLTRLGFAPRTSGSEVELNSCPILDAATALPDPLCAMHAGLVRQRLADSGGYFSASLVPFAAQGRCTVRLRAVDADVDPGEP